MGEVVDTVTAAEVIRNFGFWQQQALGRPLTVTHHGRARTMLISTDEFDRLVREAASEAQTPTPAGPELSEVLLAGMAEGFMLNDVEMRILHLNQVAVDYFGVPREKLIGSTMVDAMDAHCNQVLESMLRRVFRTGELLTYETSSTAFPNRRVSCRSFPFRGHVATLFFETTERERLEEGAREWRAAQIGLGLLDAAGVAGFGVHGRLTFADARFQAIAGIGPDDVTGFRFEDLISAADQVRFRTAFSEITASRRPEAMTLRLTTLAGDERVVTLALAPIERGMVISGVLATLADGPPVSAAAQGAEAARS